VCAPLGCVGPSSSDAGKAAACAGCPNQDACASGAAAAPDPALAAVAARLSGVRAVVLVLSGKGGVGKSTVSSQLAHTLAGRGRAVGLLDVDICGPSVPRMTGLTAARVHAAGAGWSPVWLTESLGVMSIGFLTPGEDDAVIWRGPRKNGLIKQFLTDVEWGPLDYLLVDTPPGTSDEHLSLVTLLKGLPQLAGAVVVTTPQEVAMADVRKELNFCAKTGVRVLGVVANMDGFSCAACGAANAIFPAPPGGGPAAMAARFAVPYLGALPLDPALLAACEAGRAYAAPRAGGDAAAGGGHDAQPHGTAADGGGGGAGEPAAGAGAPPRGEPRPSAAGVAAMNALAQAVAHAVEGPDADLPPWGGADE